MSLQRSLMVCFASLVLATAAGCNDDDGSGGSGGTGAHGGAGGGGTGGAGGTSTGGAGGAGGQGGQGGQGGSSECALPAEGVLAVFDVVGEPFRVQITDQAGIDGAIALWKGESQAKIPVGKLVCEAAAYNCDWQFHVDPASVTFAEVTIEVCDGTPSYVDENCGSFGEQYCPWSAELKELRDCRTDPACPVVAK